jgi:hypothetical protein
MSLSMATQLNRIREIIAGIEGMERAFSAGETGREYGIPAAINQAPAAIIFPGETREFALGQGRMHHTYEVIVQVIEGGGTMRVRAATVLPFVERVMAAFAANVKLGQSEVFARFESQGGFERLEYAGAEYLGYTITLLVREVAAVTPAVGE